VSSRDVLLSRIRHALGPDHGDGDSDIKRDYRRTAQLPQEAIVAMFAERVAEYQATVRHVRSDSLPAAIAAACRRRGVESLVVPEDVPESWLPGEIAIRRDRKDQPLSVAELDSAGGVLTGCALGIAQTGTIVLDGGLGQGRRAVTLLPDFHLCVVRAGQLVELVPEAVSRLQAAAGDTAGPITFISGPSATSDIELNRIEGVHGPRALEVLLFESGA
jgi:L-lactate dehydrogenase complex protein LldG